MLLLGFVVDDVEGLIWAGFIVEGVVVVVVLGFFVAVLVVYVYFFYSAYFLALTISDSNCFVYFFIYFFYSGIFSYPNTLKIN
jgi:hypothetical protein